jgi:hypothetical protein
MRHLKPLGQTKQKSENIKKQELNNRLKDLAKMLQERHQLRRISLRHPPQSPTYHSPKPHVTVPRKM